MNRVFRLLGVVLAFIWLHGGVSEVGTLFGREPREIGAFEEPYYTCNDANHTCEEQPGCGETRCTSNQDCGCDPDLWSQCINAGGSWNAEPFCTCDMPACYAADVDQCANDWGTWHQDGCWCESCNPSDEVVGSYPLETPLGCVDCCYREYSVTTEELHLQYCQDGRYRGQYTVGTGYLEDRRDYYCAIESWAWCSEDHPNPFYDCY